MLNSASRARSLVGRTASPGGATSRRPRYLPATMRMRGGRRRRLAELLAHHPGRHLLDLAAGEVAELERPVAESDQPGDGEAEMIEHAPHLAVLAFAQGQGEPGVGALLALERSADRAVADAVDGDAAGQRGEPLGRDRAVHPDLVAAQPAGLGQFEAAG